MRLDRPPDLPGYTLGSELGRGAMGVVFDARHAATDFEVAIKLVRPSGPQARLALENEILAMARLNHPALLYLYDYGVVGADSTFWMAVEKASGGSLEDWHPAGWDAVARVVDEVLAGLAHAHARGMVHRDLKPANLLRATGADHRPGLKIADFGLTTLRDVSTVIRRGGTPLYMPPEQARSDRGATGPWSDIYSLGAVIWEWVCGRAPFQGELRELLRQHSDAALPAFEPSFPVPDHLQGLLRHMLSKAPGERPASVADVKRALVGNPRRSMARAIRVATSGSAGARLPGIGSSLLPLRDWRLVGRGPERRALVEVLEAVCFGGAPAVVLLTGAAGVGKTRLMRWLAETAAEAGLARMLWQPEDAGRALALAYQGPTIVCFDPLDGEGEELMASLSFSRRPVLALATARRAEDWPDLSLLPGFRRVHVGPMEPAEFRDFVQTELGFSGTTAVRVDRLCEYVPGAAVDWLRDLARQGVLQPTPDGFVVEEGLLTAPPVHEDGAIHDLLAALDGFDDDVVTALRLAAVLGLRVDGAEWLRLLEGASLDVPDDALHALVRAGLIERFEDGLAWVSSGVRAAVLHPAATVAEHSAAAAALARLPETRERRFRRGVHLLHAGQRARAREILLTRDRAVELHEQELLRETLEALRPHMDGASPSEWCCFLLMELRVLLNLVSGPAAIPAADALVAAVGTPEVPGTVAAGIDDGMRLEALEFAARVYAFEHLPDKALPLLDVLPTTAATLRCRALVAGDTGEHLHAEALLRQAMELADTKAQRARLANSLGNAVARAGRHEEALTWFERTLDLLEPPQHFVPYGNMAMSLLMLGRFDEALESARAAFRVAQHRGARRVAASAIVYGVAAVRADEEELEQIADQALFSLKRYGIGDPQLLVSVLRAANPTHARTREFVDAMLIAFGAAPSA